MKLKEVEKVLYFESFIVVEPGLTTLKKGQLISEESLVKAQEEFGEDAFTAGIGAEAVRAETFELYLSRICWAVDFSWHWSALQYHAPRGNIVGAFVGSKQVTW